MRRGLKRLALLVGADDGATMAEYAIVAAAVALTCAAVVSGLGSLLHGIFVRAAVPFQ